MPETRSLQLSDIRPGAQFRQYRLLEQIGAGGQGVVWSAHDQSADRIVAIKLNEIPNTDQKKAEDQIFERQVGSLVALRHRYILPMYDYGLSGQVRYLVSPFIPGESLEARLSTEPLTIHQTLEFAARIAAALDYLHAQNVVHRDLKPANILIDFTKNLYVADFGLARVLSFSTQAMHTGRGTPPYASPEQHSMAEIATHSDLYSFGVMLYEMFTGQLPWNGQKMLGIEQLQSDAELPDPATVNPVLPAELATVLRQLTAANPALRPASAGEAMQSIYEVLQVAPIRPDAPGDPEDPGGKDGIADEILKNSLANWSPQDGIVVLSLTKYAYVELKEKRTPGQSATPNGRRFMLQAALAYNYNDDFWWTQVTDPKERLSITGQLLGGGNPAIMTRVLKHLIDDLEIRRLSFRLPEGITGALLRLAAGSNNLPLRQQVIQFLQIYTPASAKWRPKAFSAEQDLLLARLALEDSELGNEAARFIGRVRSLLALDTILESANGDRRTEALINVQSAAGGLPGSVPLQVRVGMLAGWVTRRLASEPLGLLLAYLSILAGSALTAGLQVYFTYRLPDFMDLERITVALERGIFLGAGFAVGILFVKLLVENFPEASVVIRLGIASLAGAALLAGSLFIYDTLFLQTVPTGPLMFAGCLLLAGGYAIAGLVRARLWKMSISYLAWLSALAGTWFLHASLAGTPGVLSPIFFYEYTWPAAQVLQTMLVVALPGAILSQLADLSPRND